MTFSGGACNGSVEWLKYQEASSCGRQELREREDVLDLHELVKGNSVITLGEVLRELGETREK